MKNIKKCSAVVILHNSFRDIVSEQLKLNEYDIGKCPFCHSTDNCFHLLNEHHFFYCTNCLCLGDLITFFRLFKKFSFLNTLEFLTDHDYINYKFGKISCLPSSEQDIFQDILEETVQFYHRELTNYPTDYIEERGLSELLDDNLQFGYASGRLLNHLIFDKNFPHEPCMNTGLFKDLLNGIQADIFEDTIVFPNIIDNHIVGITGRGSSVLEVVSLEF